MKRKSFALFGLVLAAGLVLSACMNPPVDSAAAGERFYIDLNGELDQQGNRILAPGARIAPTGVYWRYWVPAGGGSGRAVNHIHDVAKGTTLVCNEFGNNCQSLRQSSVIRRKGDGHWSFQATMPSSMCAISRQGGGAFLRVRVDWNNGRTESITVPVRSGQRNDCRNLVISDNVRAGYGTSTADHRFFGEIRASGERVG